MHIILDLLVVGIVVGSSSVGWRRGFVRSIWGVIGLVWAVVVVSWLAQEGLTADAPVDQLDLAVVNQGISDKFGVDILGVEDAMGATTAGEYVEAVMKHIGVTVTVSMALATIGLFASAWIGMLLIGLLLTPILKLPILRPCNGILGVAVGLISAALILMVLACVVELGGKTDPMFGAQTVEKTYIFKHITEINPLVNWITK